MAQDSYLRRALVRPLVLALTPLTLSQVLFTIMVLLSNTGERTLQAMIGAGACLALTGTVGLVLWLAYRQPARTVWFRMLVAGSTSLAALQAWHLASTLPLLAPLLVMVVPPSILRRSATTTIVVGCVTLGAGLLATRTPLATMVPMTLVGGTLLSSMLLLGRLLVRAEATAAAAHTRADAADTQLARLERAQRFWQLQQRALRHDLRPPCTVVVENVEQLQAERSCPPDPALLQEIKLQALRLRTRIDQLAEDARSQASPEPDLVALDQVVCELVPDLRGLAVAQRHDDYRPVPQVTVNAPPAAMVLSHRDTVIRIMENLVANSARAGAQSIWITVAPGSHEVRLIVQDDGPGYPDDMVAAPVVGMTAARRGTQGLGLPWIAAAMAQYGGRIELDNWHAAGDSGAQTTLVFVPADSATDQILRTAALPVQMSSNEWPVSS